MHSDLSNRDNLHKTYCVGVYFAEGRLTPNGASFYYEYSVKDHLGNVRVSFRANGTAIAFIQENHYYPFGLEMEGAWQARVGTENAYQYNSKELNEDFDLNWYDYGARWYDAAVGRWWSVDPLGEKSISVSGYVYVRNCPLLLVDPTGMESEATKFGLSGLAAEEQSKAINEREQKFDAQYGPRKDNSKGMAIFVAFPDIPADIPTNQKIARWIDKAFGDGDGKFPVGHAGVVIISPEGQTLYFDFGRFDRPDLKRRQKRGVNEGAVRSSKNYDGLIIPNWNSKKSDDENVTNILNSLHKSPLLSMDGRIIGALAKGLDFEEMRKYARNAEYEGYLPFGGYFSGYDYCNSATYCAKFARAVGYAGGVTWDWSTKMGEANVDNIVRSFGSKRIEIK